MSKPLGYYVSSGAAQELEAHYGSFLLDAPYVYLLNMRAVLTLLPIKLVQGQITAYTYKKDIDNLMHGLDSTWKFKDPLNYALCFNLLTERVNSQYIALSLADKYIVALSDAIDRHNHNPKRS